MSEQRLFATVMSIPVVEYESPMTLVFSAKIQGDVVPVKFIGDKARAMRHMIRKDDNIVITVGFWKNGFLAAEHCTMDASAAVGRNINTYA